jgi:hypothetical protein
MTRKQTHRTFPYMFVFQQLLVAHLLGACFSFLFGACIVPWCWSILSWVIHRIPWWYTHASFPNPLPYVAAPHVIVGLIWLLYYAVSDASVFHTSQPQQPVPLSLDGQHIWDEGNSRLPTPYVVDGTPGPQQKQPLSYAWTNEQKHILIERCYGEYRKALQRYVPSPVDLHTPSNFYYRKGNLLEWDIKTQKPILPEELLVPERIHELLPLLAHHLAWYNSGVVYGAAMPGNLAYLSDDYKLGLILTGNFLWLPIKVSHVITPIMTVHDADTFAVYLGQGPALELLLRRTLMDLERRGKEDNNYPTLRERIGHLEALNTLERDHMRNLGRNLQEPPLARQKKQD